MHEDIKKDSPNTKLNDQDATSTQGFEPADQNVIFVYPNDCPHCLRPFDKRGDAGTRINVFTSYGEDQWCKECVEKGLKENICVQQSRLSVKEQKLWKRAFKKKNQTNLIETLTSYVE